MSAISVSNTHFATRLVMENSKAIVQHFLPPPIGLCSVMAPFFGEANRPIWAPVNAMNAPTMLQVPIPPNPQYQYPLDFGYHYYTLERDPSISDYVSNSYLPHGDSTNSFDNFANMKISDSTSPLAIQNVSHSKGETSPGICPSVPIPQMPRTSFTVGYYVPDSVEPGDPNGGLGFVWKHQFNYLTSAFPEDSWSINPHNPTEDNVTDWIKFIDMAKVRFCCKKCKHGWTSMHGSVLFYYFYDERSREGSVLFMLTGQKCIVCKSIDFETPMWYPEEAQKVLTNLYYEIASKVYNKTTPSLIRDRRHGRPRQQHLATNCEGCLLGVCKQKLENNNNNKTA